MSDEPEFSNPTPDHSVNVSASDAWEFGHVLLYLLAAIALGVAVIYGSARWLIPLTPYSWEAQAFGGEFAFGVGEESGGDPALQALLDRLMRSTALPTGMTVRLGVLDSAEPNAYASVGGRLVVTRGLLDAVESENELAMVLAHELGHLHARDPAVALGPGSVWRSLADCSGLATTSLPTARASSAAWLFRAVKRPLQMNLPWTCCVGTTAIPAAQSSFLCAWPHCTNRYEVRCPHSCPPIRATLVASHAFAPVKPAGIRRASPCDPGLSRSGGHRQFPPIDSSRLLPLRSSNCLST